MGYTHYWTAPLADPDYARLWPRILTDTQTIIDAVRARGVVIADWDGYRRPLLDLVDGIAFNGDATTDLDAETFTLPAPGSTARGEGFCKTNRNPYDLAVAGVLLHCQLLLPHTFRLRSDGGWDTDWLHGPGPISGARIGARQLVADLFGPIPADAPFAPPSWLG